MIEFDGPGMPYQITNAALDDELVMRVGVPHRGGRLAGHAWEEGHPVMVSANAFWDNKASCFKHPVSQLAQCDVALDSAGFVAMMLFKQRGRQPGMAGVFPWTYEQYLTFATCFGARWYSAPDMCCEPELANKPEDVDFRVRATATLLEGTLRVLNAWHNELAKDTSAEAIHDMARPPVPILQGWDIDSYLRSLELTMGVWERWEPWLAPPALIGIGSVCRRSLGHPKHGLYAVLSALEGRLPAGSRVHLFGVKGAALEEVKMMPWVASADSMAYDFGARIDARKAGVSNTLEHRTQAMSRWMRAAEQRMRPKAGDQFRLAF